MSSLVFRISCCWCVLLAASGCTRTHYRLRADSEAYSILTEKSASTPWRLPFGFSVEPDPRSRFYDVTPTDDPWLPVPAPQLYAYSLPELPKRDFRRFGSRVPAPNDVEPRPQISHLSSREDESAADHASYGLQSGLRPTRNASKGANFHLTDIPSPRTTSPNPNAVIRSVAYQADSAELAPENGAAADAQASGDEDDAELRPLHIEDWKSVPESCQVRMFEFASVCDEYARTYGQEPSADQRDQSQRLALEDIVELALINSRQYQTRKESLYRTALRLSIERFDYDMKFTTGGNGNSVDYSHNRATGITENGLGVPTTFTENAVLATGGDLLARFANDVVLTFNGPSGFAADVGSDLLLDISQSVFQRDIALEGLTQAERDVIYVARDFIRFRKQLFAELAGRYYDLLLAYRGVEIAAQAYFRDSRGFDQAEAERQEKELPRFQVDQFEQSKLASRSRLISTCNTLERDLDNLKLAIGLPPELPVTLNLDELEILTLADKVTVAEKAVERWQRELRNEYTKPQPGRTELINSVDNLVRRMLNLIEARQDLVEARDGVTEENTDTVDLEVLLSQSQVDQAGLQVSSDEEALRKEEAEEARKQQEAEEARKQQEAEEVREEEEAEEGLKLDIFLRATALVDSRRNLLDKRLEFLELLESKKEELEKRKRELDKELLEEKKKEHERRELEEKKKELDRKLLELIEPRIDDKISEIKRELPNLQNRNAQLQTEQKQAVDTNQLDRIPELVQSVRALAERASILVSRLVPLTSDEELKDKAKDQIDRSKRMLKEDVSGLAPVEIEVDDAMLTALTLRFDLMNERGTLADVWRQIKLAGDDLKSILNLQATQQIRTRSDVNRPFDFTFDDSQTRLTMTFDAPLNRKSQRNLFRQTLIDYNAALRNLMESEDSIKLSVRNDLRELQLDRQQYDIAVASAALADDRVASTRLQFRKGIKNVTARDVLESQNVYTASLESLAGAHIRYIRDRIELFQDLELLEVDDTGFWPQLYDTRFQPEPNFELPVHAGPVYGDLPRRTWHSPKIRRMLCVPAGEVMIFDTTAPQPSSSGSLPAPPPDQPTAF